MANTSGLLLAQNFRRWLSARGFFLVVLAAMIPLLLTGSWVATHQRDVAATAINLPAPNIVEGTTVNISATIQNKGNFGSGEFNATLAVWNQGELTRLFNPFTGQLLPNAERLVTGGSLNPAAENTTKMDGLGANEERQITLSWTPTAGSFIVIAAADSGNADDALAQVLFGVRRDDVPELEEFNNLRFDLLTVGFSSQNETFAPQPPGNLTGPSSATATTDVVLENLRLDPPEPSVGESLRVFVDVVNNGSAPANVNVTVKTGQSFSGELFGGDANEQRFEPLQPGERRTVEMSWSSVSAAASWAQAYANVTDGARDTNAGNNHLARPIAPGYDRQENFTFPEPSEKLTIKRFYADIIGNIQISILIPFIALFYAAGAVADERERGNLAYILTRPVPRAMIPAAKFIASFFVASVALTIGVLGTYFLLLGTPQSNIGLLTTPLFISILALLCYGAVFLLVGVVFERPYLTGLLLIAWEWAVAVGSTIRLFGEPVVAPWVKNATLYHHLNRAFQTWDSSGGVQWLPKETEALLYVLGAAVVAILLSAYVMRTREFDV